MKWTRLGRCAVAVSLMWCVAPAWAAEPGPYMGVDLGVSEPTNDNYRSHVETGASGSPFFGTMFNEYLGLEVEGHIIGQPADDNRNRAQAPDGITCFGAPPNKVCGSLNHPNGWTTMFGVTAGPRIAIPLTDRISLYGIGQGGGYKGMTGRLNQWAPGFSVGGGIDFGLTDQVSVGLFGRWNRVYMAPHPTRLAGHVEDDQGPKDARFATGGVRITYSFAQAAPPPPPPPPPVAEAPPPPPPAPVAKKKVVLRSINFDFNKAEIKSESLPVLNELVSQLKGDSHANAVLVTGHTDSIGSDAYNNKLSVRRAAAVRDYLVRKGIASDRIKIEGRGKSNPVASNATAEGRAENRRVEVDIK